MKKLLNQLRSWQRREWLYTAMVLASSLVLMAAFALLSACLVDYYVDASGATPFWLRAILSIGQVLLFAGLCTAGLTILKQRTPSVVALAGRAEREYPEFDHLMVTAIQLNAPTANRTGMSQQLIESVTADAGELAKKYRLAALADPNRLWVALGLLIPVAIAAGFCFGFHGKLSTALVQRQLLMDVEIPRSLDIENASKPIYPAGDPLKLQVKVTGRTTENTAGTLIVIPDSGSAEERYDLRFSKLIDDETAIFEAELPPFSEPFSFRATVRDGRMRQPARVEFRPRPVVTGITARVLAPAYVDPDGVRRYETLANEGEVSCHPDCGLRIEAKLSKPVVRGSIVLFGKGIEHSIPLAIDAEAKLGRAECEIPPGVFGYRIEVVDEHGFANLVPPRRGITLLPDRPPAVALLDEILMPGWETGPTDDFEVRGMPLILGGQIQIGYTAKSALGIARVFLVYRVNEGPWTTLPLTRVEADESKVGKFRPELGAFASYDVDQNVEFYPLPSPDPESEAPGLSAGGRYNFLTSALVKRKDGQAAKLELGDRVEIRVAAYDRKPGPTINPGDVEAANLPPEERRTPDRPAGYSESRLRTVVGEAAFEQWRDQQTRSRERLREIEKLQRGVFGQRGASEK